jgi:hypothetical protein
MPSWVLAQPAFPDVCRDLAQIAEGHYAAAGEAIAACPRWTMRPAAVVLAIVSLRSPRASRAGLAAARRTNTNTGLAQTGPRDASRADRPLKTHGHN